MPNLITLTTDFGTASPYVAAMKGVILSIHPEARVLDLTHAVPPQAVRHASFFLSQCVGEFPAGSIHVAVVDPGVGGERDMLLAAAGGQFVIAPDNGLITGALARLGGPAGVRRLENPAYRKSEVSATFHGRDVFAPAAAHLSRGVAPADFGPALEEWVTLPTAGPRRDPDGWAGEVIFIDDFGNLITNLTGEHVASAPAGVTINGEDVRPVRWARTYAEGEDGDRVMLLGSGGHFEVAVVNGSAAAQLTAGVGDRVFVKLPS